MNDVIVRNVHQDDAAALIGILNPIIQSGCFTVLDQCLTAEQECEFITQFPSRGVFHVAELAQSGEVVGMQDVEPFATYTGALDHVGIIATFVDLSRRHNGIGLKMSESTFDAARKKGFEKLFTYVRADNPTALEFYRKMGFRIVGTAERHAKIGDSYIDEVVIEKLLLTTCCR